MSAPVPNQQFPHAVLWHGRSIGADDLVLTTLIKQAGIAPIDQQFIQGSELNVAAATILKSFASRSPHQSRYKLITIIEADQLSSAVANSLLKLIEEPPAFLLIRLNAQRASSVLVTLRSRCHQQFLGDQVETDNRFPWHQVRQQSLAEQFALAETLAADDQLEAVVTHWLAELEADLLQGQPVDASIALGLQLVQRLRTNANRRLALESWFVSHHS